MKCAVFRQSGVIYVGPSRREGLHKKLRTTKTARFCGRLFLGCESYRYASKKLRDVKIFILTESCFSCGYPSGITTRKIAG